MEPFKIILRNKKNSKNLYPIILRINKDRRSKIITLGLSCKKEDWDAENYIVKRRDKHYIFKNTKLNELEERAKGIIEYYELNNIDFSLEEFENKFRRKDPIKVSVSDFFDKIINELLKAGKVGAAKVYINTKSSFFKIAKMNLMFREITPDFLRNYEAYLRAEGNVDGGIAIKMRDIRRIFNRAINDDIASLDNYPFRKYKISRLEGSSRKIALSQEEMAKFIKVNITNHPGLQNSYRYFVFMYYTRGMNFKDMMKLEWKNIKDNRIYYTRSKTKKKLNVKILEPVQIILDFFEKQKRNTEYVFPILLNNNMTPVQIYNRKHKTLRKFNKDLKALAEIAGIKSKITSYVSRHSYATHMKQKGVSIEVISESMGHSSVLVTIAYLKEFENEYLDQENEKLIEESEAKYNKDC